MQDRLYRALAVLRVVVLLNAVGLNLYRVDNFAHPVGGAVCVLVMAAWTVVTIVLYADPARRGNLLHVVDLAVATGLILVSPLVKGDDMRATVPGFWVMGALVACSLRWSWRGGLVAGLVLTAADLSVRQDVGQGNYGNIFLLVVGGLVIGYLAGSLTTLEQERDAAQREVIAGEERARLARAVHDGVLQVLSLVQRRGGELAGLSPEFADLGRLAGEQEAELRALIHRQDSLPDAGGRHDLAAALEEVARAASIPVTVSTPGRAVELPAEVVAEVAAAVRACLANVARHVGADAPAWVLLEDDGDRVVVTVRDEGPGIPADRLAAAEGEGRLGVSESIVGRLVALGGTATVDTGGFGTEWELAVRR